jgi:lipopolysaccharide export system protein LptA
VLKRLSLTLTVTAGLTGLYWLYALVVTPRLEPPLLAAPLGLLDDHEEMKAEPPPGNRSDAERYLPAASWAAQAKYQIRLASGVLFSETWKPQGDSRDVYEFQPFAMILFDTSGSDGAGADDSTDKPPTTLVSERGLVRFSSEFDPVNQKVGRVINCKLEGQVTVTGPDGLTVHGRDIFFDESTKELRSDASVEFTYQQHHGTAEGLKVDLLPAERLRPDQLLAIEGVRRVTLRDHVEMNLVSRDGPLHITCDGSFSFNPGERVASFQKNVQVAQHLSRGPPNRMRGDDLILFFEEAGTHKTTDTPQSRGDAPTVVPLVHGHSPAVVAATPPVGLGPARSSDSSLTLRNLQFTGRVELESPSNDVLAFMSSLKYDVSSRTAELEAVPAEGSAKRVELTSVIIKQKRSGLELSSPYLKLIHDERGQIVSANGQGIGRLRRRVADSDEIDLSAKWQNRFELKPEPNGELDRLTLVGRAILEQPTRETGLKGDQIHMWFDRPTGQRRLRSLASQGERQSVRNAVRATDSQRPDDMTSALSRAVNEREGFVDALRRRSTVSTNEATPQEVPTPELTVREFRPRQLQAQDNVVVISPQLSARSHSFVVDFQEVTEESTPSNELTKSSKSRRRVRPASAESQSQERSAEPLQLTADRIRVNVKLKNDSTHPASGDHLQTELNEVWTEGNVDIQQSRRGDEEPLHLTGEKLHMRNASRHGQQVLHIFGQPAVIRARGFDVEGNEVFLDRLNNRTWIEGAGALRMPVKNDFEGRKLASSALLTVWWKEKMLFDGQTATFLNNVKAALSDSRLQCEEMEVVLTERMSFQEDSGLTAQAEVRRVICKDGVEIDHTLYADKELAEIRRGQFATLTLDQQSGRMVADGPGEISMWRPGRGKRAALAPRAVAQANRPLESEVSSWEFTRINFFGKTIGNLHERQTKFQDRVHIVYGPVANPLGTIDPDHLPKDGGVIECDTLQILQRKESNGQKPFVELEAKGNAKLEGRTFNARADEITFDESKELYTLRATGNRNATIWRQSTLNGEPSEAEAKTWRFIPSTNYLKADQSTGIRQGQ